MMRRRFAVLLLLFSLSPCTAQLPAGLTTVSRLDRLAAKLVDAPAALRADLAAAAISELALVYTEEAQRARQDMQRRKGERELRRWTAAVEELADEYALLARGLTPATPVEVSIGPEGSLYLIVDGRPVAVASPRLGEQMAFEQRVLARFCERNRCENLVDEPGSSVPASLEGTNSAAPRWSFSQNAGPVCSTGDGLEFQFLNADNLGEKRVACSRVVAELNALAAAIVQREAGGVRVEWNSLALHSLANGQGEQVVLNKDGDYLRIEAPALAVTPALFTLVRPWLAAKVKGERYRLVVINAGRLLAPYGQGLE